MITAPQVELTLGGPAILRLCSQPIDVVAPDSLTRPETGPLIEPVSLSGRLGERVCRLYEGCPLDELAAHH